MVHLRPKLRQRWEYELGFAWRAKLERGTSQQACICHESAGLHLSWELHLTSGFSACFVAQKPASSSGTPRSSSGPWSTVMTGSASCLGTTGLKWCRRAVRAGKLPSQPPPGGHHQENGKPACCWSLGVLPARASYVCSEFISRNDLITVLRRLYELLLINKP